MCEETTTTERSINISVGGLGVYIIFSYFKTILLRYKNMWAVGLTKRLVDRAPENGNPDFNSALQLRGVLKQRRRHIFNIGIV